MSKIPSGKKFIKFLEKMGFYSDRQKGSHVIMKNNKGEVAVVPVHGNKELKLGLFKGLLKDVKISEEEFLKNK